MKKLLLILVLAVMCSSVARADESDDINEAFKKGNYAQAMKLLLPLASQGDASAQSNLGLMYANGEGVTQDYKEAVKWYQLAAAQGYTAAQFNLGFMYTNGQGVIQDYNEEVKWYKLAAA